MPYLKKIGINKYWEERKKKNEHEIKQKEKSIMQSKRIAAQHILFSVSVWNRQSTHEDQLLVTERELLNQNKEFSFVCARVKGNWNIKMEAEGVEEQNIVGFSIILNVFYVENFSYLWMQLIIFSEFGPGINLWSFSFEMKAFNSLK